MEQNINEMTAGSGKILNANNEVVNWGDSITEHGIHTTITELRALNEGRNFCATYIAEALTASGTLVTHIKTGAKRIDIKFVVESGYASRCALYVDPTITQTEGTAEVDSLEVTAVATADGNVTTTLDGVAVTTAVLIDDTAAEVADKIRDTLFTGWTVGGTEGTTTVTFTADEVGVRATPIYSEGDTGAEGTMSVTTPGVDIADINGTEFSMFNKYLKNTNENTANIYYTPTTTSLGTKLGERQNGEGERRSSGSMVTGYGGSIVVPANTSAIYTIQNKGEATAVVTAMMEWLEFDD